MKKKFTLILFDMHKQETVMFEEVEASSFRGAKQTAEFKAMKAVFDILAKKKCLELAIDCYTDNHSMSWYPDGTKCEGVMYHE